MLTNVPDLYQKHHIDKSDERLGLFVLMAEQFAVQSALYPGSFVHLTPSFVFPVTCFVDTDKRAARFFADPAVLDFVKRQKSYDQDPLIRFHKADYARRIDEDDETFDLLISQYAGFVSQACKRYLKINGLLLVNNSHGDASMASIDSDYQLVAVVNRRGERFSLSQENLGDYLAPKKDVEITRQYLEQTQRGVGYKKSAFSYVFQRVA